MHGVLVTFDCNLPVIRPHSTLELLFGRKSAQAVRCRLWHADIVSLKRSILYSVPCASGPNCLLPVALKRATGLVRQAALALADIAEVDLQML